MNRIFLLIILMMLHTNCVISQEQCTNEFNTKIIKIAGFHNNFELKNFYQELIRVLESKNIQNLKKLHNFKVKINYSRKSKINSQFYNDVNDIKDDFYDIFSDEVISSFLEIEFCDSFVNWQGVMIHNEKIWITPIVVEKSEYYLITINK